MLSGKIAIKIIIITIITNIKKRIVMTNKMGMPASSMLSVAGSQ